MTIIWWLLLREGVNKNSNLKGTSPISPYIGDDKEIVNFFKYFIRTCLGVTIQKMVLLKKVFQGMLNIFTLWRFFVAGGGQLFLSLFLFSRGKKPHILKTGNCICNYVFKNYFSNHFEHSKMKCSSLEWRFSDSYGR